MELAKIKIRAINQDDTRRIWEIRNYPAVRDNSSQSDEIPLDKHISWFNKKYFSGQTNACFVLEYDQEVAGYCRFDSEDKGFRVSIALDPAYHGKGFGTFFLAEASSKFGQDKTLLAEIKKNNQPSVQIFKKVGFHVINESDTYWYFQKDPILA